MSSLIDTIFKNEYAKRFYTMVGIKKPFVKQDKTAHYRMPILENNGGYAILKNYSGPAIPKEEWENLEYTTYGTDTSTYFAPLASATGVTELKGFWDYGRPDLDGVWTENAKKCPTIVKWIESIGVRYGRVQLIRMAPNTLRECRWGLHLDDNNRKNPTTNGWVVRVWLELTDDPESSLVLRKDQFDLKNEVRVPLQKNAQAVVDSEFLFHGGFHKGPNTRYGVIVSFESTPKLEEWIKSQKA